MTENKQKVYGLQFADGAAWNIVAENHESINFVNKLAEVMQLSSPNGNARNLHIKLLNGNGSNRKHELLGESSNGLFAETLAEYPWEEECLPLKQSLSCNINKAVDESTEAVHVIQCSSIFALDSVTRGGVLIHGALIERDGVGVILAGRGGAGKTTASSRLPETWHTLSDDTSLIVRDEWGNYWAHPWPTWSRFLLEEVGGRWDVGRGVRLGGICYISKSTEVTLSTMGEGELVCLLVESVEQVSRVMSRQLEDENVRKLKSLYFRNICQMAKKVPGFRLSLDLKSPFWELIEDLTCSNNPESNE